MQITGHIAGGYLVSKAITSQWDLPPTQRRVLIGLGTVAGALPDLDVFIHLARTQSLEFGSDFQHHKWITHTFPFYWIPLLLVWLYAKRRGLTNRMQAAIVMIGGTTIHLLQDMIGSGDGIMWAWPLSKRMDGIVLLKVHGREWERVYNDHPIAWVERTIILLAVIVLVRGLLQSVLKSTSKSDDTADRPSPFL